jgi:hypothetical protein
MGQGRGWGWGWGWKGRLDRPRVHLRLRGGVLLGEAACTHATGGQLTFEASQPSPALSAPADPTYSSPCIIELFFALPMGYYRLSARPHRLGIPPKPPTTAALGQVGAD